MYVIRSSTLITKKDGEFFPVYEENRERSIFAVFSYENAAIFVADRLNTIMYRHYGVEWENHPNAYGVVDHLNINDIVDVRQWGMLYGVFTPLEVDNAGVVERNTEPRITVLTQSRSAARWIASLLDKWEREREEEDTSSTISTIVVEM